MSVLLSTVALPVTAGLILLFSRLAPRLDLVDVPGGRKQHHGEVPLVGGLAMFGGMLAAALIAGMSTSNLALLTALALLVVKGYADDRFDLRPLIRFSVQALAVLIMVYWGGVRLESLGDLTGLGEVVMGVWTVPMTIFAVLGVISAMNMIDGADGLAGGLALIALIVFSGFAMAGGFLEETLLLPLVFAVLGFMLFNARTPVRKRAAVFMGEAGSVLLGFALAWHAVDLANVRQAFTPITAVWILGVPIMDTVGLMLRRVIKGRSPLSADNEHLHHVLQRAGFSHCQTVMIVWVIATVMAVIGVAGWKLGVPEYIMFYGFLTLFALWQR